MRPCTGGRVGEGLIQALTLSGVLSPDACRALVAMAQLACYSPLVPVCPSSYDTRAKRTVGHVDDMHICVIPHRWTPTSHDITHSVPRNPHSARHSL